MMKNMNLLLRYPVTLQFTIEDEEEFFYAYSKDFPGVLGDGETMEEAARDFYEVLEDVLNDRE